jgi:sialidase-1
MVMIKGEHIVIFRERYRYVLGPCIAVAPNGDWLCTFNMSVRREVGPDSPRPYIHPPYDPEYRNQITRSRDGGKTWEAPRVLPGYEWHGLEHAALCVLRNGDILASHYQRTFYPLETARKMTHLYGWNHRPPYPWVVSHGGTYVHRSTDGGLTWGDTVEIDTGPFISGYSPRPIVEMDDGTLIYTAGAADPMFRGIESWYRSPNVVINGLGNELDEEGRIVEGPSAAFICMSRDGGKSWTETRLIARHPEYYFVEPTMIQLRSGRLLCHMRNCQQTGHLWQVVSDDRGETWSAPAMTPMWGYPAHVVQLHDGRVLSVYGHRREPYGIRACLSDDDGESWDYENELIIRDDLVKRSIGYPTATVLDDDTVFTVYWDEDAEGVTSIVGTHFKP